MEPSVSYVMPAWRPDPGWFRQAVTSVLREPEALELIVVDDGSPEPAEPLLTTIDDSRLRVLRVEHGGVSRARNAGMAESQGRFIRYVDADDVVAPGSTRRLLDRCNLGTNVIGYGATVLCDEGLRPIWSMTTGLQGDVREPCLLGLFFVRLSGLLFPRAVVEATGLWNPELQVAEDWDFVLRALDHATVRGDEAPASYYRRHRASATADTAAGKRGARHVVEAYFERHPERAGSPLERRAHARLHATLARVLITRGSWRAAARPLRQALAADPAAVLAEVGQARAAVFGKVKHRLRPASPVETR